MTESIQLQDELLGSPVRVNQATIRYMIEKLREHGVHEVDPTELLCVVSQSLQRFAIEFLSRSEWAQAQPTHTFCAVGTSDGGQLVMFLHRSPTGYTITPPFEGGLPEVYYDIRVIEEAKHYFVPLQ